ncbi:BTAD domain-containing putative transcriptional regulator [Nocardioides sp. HM23]|uniref:BTAD domain-containing putative transcriptional regulator n=1 Tax=Nocardioides bizhenqiangii TaxID=3095076 RepID=UPI002ACA4961|nr:BTAD domain-containing putative transcriptional regulator [Nocardioides sp. HM23]MDZ5619235.1 BTAD domain-containing putative transcriptional regulator [Nocardioides sp. HM23]
MHCLRIAVLGPLEATIDGAPIDLGSRKQRAVLGVLTALAPAAVPVERLVDEIWGDAGPANPLRSLQVYVSALRSALGEYGDRLATEGRAYRLIADGVEIDAERFSRLVRQAAAEPDPDAAVALVDEALALWRGEPWQDLRDLPLVAPVVVALEAERLTAAAVRARALLSLGRHRELVPWLEPLVEQHPLNEELRGHLMLALHRSDRQADALEVYAAGRETKADETGLDPGEDLQRLQAAILTDDPALRVEDVELRSRRHLPAPVTSLVGRETEIASVVALLREPDNRLVTITGPGGIGKTRLSIAVARGLAADHPDGVWFVALDAVHDHRLVAGAVADALEVETSGGDVPAALKAHLRDLRMLLVLDNFEQVDDAAPLVSDLLAAAAGLRVLVTSRVRLRLYGERVVPLDPLATIDAGPLFVERARGVDPGFDAPPHTVAQLCDQLDGIPLAIELVAARVDEIPFETLHKQLAERQALDLATHGPRDRSSRQRTLRDAIAWSVALLPEELAGRFARLAVFDGGFTAGAAAAVTGVTSADLTALVRASLVVDAGGGRFRLLETLREYAGELLGDAHDQVADAHAEWYRRFVLDADGRISIPAWIKLIDPDRANLRAALERLYVTAHDDTPVGVRLLELTSALGRYWYHVGPASADTEWLPRALALATDADPTLRGSAAYALAICRGEQGLVEEAIEHCRTAYDLLRDGPDPLWAARALNSLASLTHDIGRSEEAAPLLDESIALRRTLGGALPLAIPLSNRASVAVQLGDAATARSCLEEILRVEGDDELEAAFAMMGMADVELLAGDPDAAAVCLRTAVETVMAEDYQDYRLMECLETFAALAVVRGRADLAATLLAAVDRAYADEGSVMVPADIRLRERRTGAALAALGPEARRAAEDRGTALDLQAAVRLARQELL